MSTRPARASVWLLATFVCACGTAGQGGRASEARIEAEIRAVYERLLSASVEKDEAALRQLLADDYLQVTANGVVRSKEERIREAVRPYAPGDELTLLRLEHFEPRIFGETVSAFCRVRQAGTYQGSAFDSTILSTALFVRRDGVWQIVSTHLTFAPAEP